MLETFFFFIGGIQPRTKVLDVTPRRCPACGLHQARLSRVDHYISLFFIPVFKVKTGEPVLICRRCGDAGSERGPGHAQSGSGQAGGKSCRYCNKDFPAEYTFCPGCGRRL